MEATAEAKNAAKTRSSAVTLTAHATKSEKMVLSVSASKYRFSHSFNFILNMSLVSDF